MRSSRSSPDPTNPTVSRAGASNGPGAIGPRVPGAVRLLGALVGLQGILLVATGLLQGLQAFVAEHVMPVGAIVLMGLLYVGYGLWLLLAARGLLRGSLWPRALIVLTQVFLVVVCVQLVGAWSWWLAVLGIVYAVFTAVVLFAPAVQNHLLSHHYGVPEAGDGRQR